MFKTLKPIYIVKMVTSAGKIQEELESKTLSFSLVWFHHLQHGKSNIRICFRREPSTLA